MIKSTKRFRREYWHEFVYRSENYSPFPLNVFPPAVRPVVNSFDSFCNLMEYYRSKERDCYYSLFPMQMRWMKTLDVLWFDVDYNEHVKEKMEVASSKIDLHLEAENIPFRRYITANRGLHYYILIEPIELNNWKYAVKQWMLTLPEIPKTIKFRTLPDGTIKSYPASGYDKDSSNWEQLVRLPFTIHPKTGLEMVECYGKIEFMPEIEIRSWEVAKGVSKQLKKFDREAPKRKKFEVNTRAVVDYWPHCIFDAIELLSTPDSDKHESRISHDQSRHLTAFLYRVGWSKEKIIAFFEKVRPDYQSYTCSYQVNNIVNSGYFPNNCENTRRIGLCPEEEKRFDKCPFYPSIMTYLRDVAEENGDFKTDNIESERLKWVV